jgi:hypothetical protein
MFSLFGAATTFIVWYMSIGSVEIWNLCFTQPRRSGRPKRLEDTGRILSLGIEGIFSIVPGGFAVGSVIERIQVGLSPIYLWKGLFFAFKVVVFACIGPVRCCGPHATIITRWSVGAVEFMMPMDSNEEQAQHYTNENGKIRTRRNGFEVTRIIGSTA